eukprot:Em0020g1073a
MTQEYSTSFGEEHAELLSENPHSELWPLRLCSASSDIDIMFENIRNETSIYYLLSNNHVNSLIVLKLDFSDEEVLAYYISFLKTLSFKLNKHTIHFFYNEHLRDFPLYNEAVKFFSHSESMVRIAVRTLTLNVFKDQRASKDATPHISTTMAAFPSLSGFVTLSHSTLVTLLAYFILSGDESLMLPANFTQPSHVPRTPRGFLPPDTGLEPSGYVPARPVKMHWRKRSGEEMSEEDRAVGAGAKVPVSPRHGVPISDSSYRDAILKSLAIHSADSRCFFSLFLLLSMLQNSGINPMLLEAFQLKPVPSENGVAQYSDELLLYRLVDRSGASVPLRDEHFALLEHAYEASILQLSHFCRGSKDELFLDMFEEEYMNEMAFNVKLNFLVMDGFMLLPPLDTPTTGIDFAKRLPNGDTEKARKAMRVFLAIHNAHHDLYKLEESELPFSRSEYSAHIGESIDLNNYHLLCLQRNLRQHNQRPLHGGHRYRSNVGQPSGVTCSTTRLGIGSIHCVLTTKKCLLNNKDKLRMAKMSRIRKLFRFPDHATVAAEEGAFATADETASSSSDSDTSLVVVHSTLVPNRSQCSPQPPPSHYIELTTLSSPPFDPTNPPDPHIMFPEGTTGSLCCDRDPMFGITVVQSFDTEGNSPSTAKSKQWSSCCLTHCNGTNLPQCGFQEAIRSSSKLQQEQHLEHQVVAMFSSGRGLTFFSAIFTTSSPLTACTTIAYMGENLFTIAFVTDYLLRGRSASSGNHNLTADHPTPLHQTQHTSAQYPEVSQSDRLLLKREHILLYCHSNRAPQQLFDLFEVNGRALQLGEREQTPRGHRGRPLIIGAYRTQDIQVLLPAELKYATVIIFSRKEKGAFFCGLVRFKTA